MAERKAGNVHNSTDEMIGMGKPGIVVLTALLLAGCSGTSSIEPPATELLEGGVPVRLGGPFAQLDHFRDQSSGEDGSLLRVEIDQGPYEYSYWPSGGIELGVAQPFAYLGMACVGTETQDTTWAPALAARARAKLGGRWRVGTPPRHGVAWIRDDDVRVRYSMGPDFSDVCILRDAPPRP